MSLIARARHHLSYASLSKHLYSPVVASCSHRLATRHFAQSATSENEDEEIEIDQRRRLPTDYDPEKFDLTEHRSPPSERVWKLVDEMAGLTIVEAAELGTILMRKSGMGKPVIGFQRPGCGGVAGGAMKAAATKEEKKSEKTVFEVKLESFDAASKLKVIKEIRSFTDLGLKEAKDLVEKAPAILKKGLSKQEAEQIIEKMKAIGAKVVME